MQSLALHALLDVELRQQTVAGCAARIALQGEEEALRRQILDTIFQ
jgi:hypothetical protein